MTDLVIPQDPQELARCLADPMWRLGSGMYQILVKGDDDGDEGTIVAFRPNRAQRRFIARMWHRNIILKARQLGFTTLICILWLDHALFNANQRCGVIAHDRDSAKVIFRDKVKFAYEHLPPQILALIPTVEMNADEILFSNGSSVRVATSMRSGTLHRLLVSEYGKICAKYPDKADEVKKGSLPAVPTNGVAVIESTAEGQQGDFFKMTEKSQAAYQQGKTLGPKDWRFHFFPWWQEERYRVDPSTVLISPTDDAYFLEAEGRVKADMGLDVTFDAAQRAWYVATREGDFGGDEQAMWQEYPSYPAEAFKVSTEGTYYAIQLARARKEGRIGMVPHMPGIVVDTYWDIGVNDLNAIWLGQSVGAMQHWIGYMEASGEPPSYYVRELEKLGYVWGRHFLPHDGAHRRIGESNIKTYEEMLQALGFKRTVVVDRVTHLTNGIDLMREKFAMCRFDEKNCAQGLTRLQNYRKQWNTRLQTWADEPLHDENSNGADAIRQWAQGWTPGHRPKKKGRPVSWKAA
jgi:hypothetical protein